KEKIFYQFIIARLDGDRINDNDYAQYIISLVKKGLGGVIVFGGNLHPVKGFIKKLQELSELPLWVSADAERGLGQQLTGATTFAGNMATASAIDLNKPEDLELLKSALRALADELIYTGINMPLVPTLDVNSNPDNPIICTRAFSDDSKTVANFGNIYINVLQSKGLVACCKHFPGHGDTDIDSHMALPVINKDLSDLQSDLFPFHEAIKAGVKSLMLGHLVVKAFDNIPASLSSKVIKGLLRQQWGYEGLLLTDALNMDALKDFGNVEATCINAGIDILLHPNNPLQSVANLKQALKNNLLSEETLYNAYLKLVNTKKALLNPQSVQVDFAKNEKISMELFKKSFCIVQDKSHILPLKSLKDCNVYFFGEQTLYDVGYLKQYITGCSHKTDTALVFVFTSVNAWKGTLGISDTEKNAIIQILKQYNKSVVISFGSPYVLRHFSEATALVSAFEPTLLAQKAFVKMLVQKADFKGSLPINFFKKVL
ncbi:MAG: hypothetical protein N2738_09680, partial [Thermodesulfovibrionales bacterium]|nr:hypothetical protein [Thermodesulfovibrionales bacterium]